MPHRSDKSLLIYICYLENITKYLDERLPEEYEKCLGLNSIAKGAWAMSHADSNGKGDKIKALTLAKE
jgi:hypothetical protein